MQSVAKCCTCQSSFFCRLTLSSWVYSYSPFQSLEHAAVPAVQISEGHRRNAITYTSLICAAEKSGQWQLALELFHRVAADNVAPNAAIFNAAMSACAQGTSESHGAQSSHMQGHWSYGVIGAATIKPQSHSTTSAAALHHCGHEFAP